MARMLDAAVVLRLALMTSSIRDFRWHVVRKKGAVSGKRDGRSPVSHFSIRFLPAEHSKNMAGFPALFAIYQPFAFWDFGDIGRDHQTKRPAQEPAFP